MSTIKHLKKQSLYFRAISEVLSYVNNANISWPTVTTVRLTNDSSHLFVYLTFENNQQKSLENLKNIKGFVRSELAKGMKQRKVPDIHFELDESYIQGLKIEKILADIKKKP